MNILTLADLTKVTEYELLSYKNFGETSLTEIKNILNQKGLRLGQAVESEIFIDADTGVNEDNLSKLISEIELSDNCRNSIEEMGIETINDLVAKTETELLEQEGFTQVYVDELITQLYKLGLKLHSGNNVGQNFDTN